MQIYLFRAFLAIEYARSLSEAARAVPCAQSTLSRQVIRLESKLGVKLFERYGRQVEWTTTGELPLPPLMDGWSLFLSRSWSPVNSASSFLGIVLCWRVRELSRFMSSAAFYIEGKRCE
jgi:hypothetical protein